VLARVEHAKWTCGVRPHVLCPLLCASVVQTNIPIIMPCIINLNIRRVSANLLRSDVFQGKRVLVTGASSGIGRACAERFLELGAHVVFAGRNVKVLEEIEALHSATGRVFTVAADLALSAECRRLVDTACELLPGGEIDILVNNAGILPRLGMSIASTTDDEYESIMDVNLRAPFIVLQESIKKMPRGGRVSMFDFSIC
jgi:3-oxoacyl-[acyl-carrier protein] reductase